MNGYLIFILAVLLLGYLLETVVSLLNLRALSPILPVQFKDVFDQEKYARSQDYTRTTTRFGLIRNSVSTVLTVLFIVLGGFNWADSMVRSLGLGSIATGLLFIGLIVLIAAVVGLPFSIYATFVIEERFGFNKTTVRTFVLDMAKSLVLGLIIGAPLLAFVLWFFETGGTFAWLYCWLAVIGFVITVQFLAPVCIMPLFNKFTPLAEGELKERIMEYAGSQHFRMKGIYTMDGSKRSTRLNAFFTGFGRFRRIVFFDTLVDKLTAGEIVAVLAHEMGHYKLRHIFRMLAVSVVQTGIMFSVLSLFINNQGLFDAFRMEHLSIYASLFFFGFLYAPISMFLDIFNHYLSRRHEYEADGFVVATTGRAGDLVSGLKKLSAANLVNLTPHPLHVFLNYSHPPVQARIRALESPAGHSRENGND
jgi:STE24 endopeptidase